MATLTRRVGRAGLAALTALALAVTAPADAHAARHGVDRPGQPVAKTFLPRVDSAWYVSAPRGPEAGAADWTLDGAATTVEGNEPYFVGGADDQRSLSLPRGASATTAAICIGVEHPTIRFFAPNTRSPDSTLAVSVRVSRPRRAMAVAAHRRIAGGSAWTPTPVLAVTPSSCCPRWATSTPPSTSPRPTTAASGRSTTSTSTPRERLTVRAAPPTGPVR